MDPQVAQRFEALEQRRKALVERVRALLADRQVFKPGGNAFSALELLKHFAATERLEVDRMKGTPEGAKGRPSLIYRLVLGSLLRATRPLPPLNGTRPTGTFTVDQAAGEWEGVRRELGAQFEKADCPETVVEKAFPFGALTAADVLALIEAHTHYHETRFPA